eukprot:2740738-Prymnesium_polylepis.1
MQASQPGEADARHATIRYGISQLFVWRAGKGRARGEDSRNLGRLCCGACQALGQNGRAESMNRRVAIIH